MIKSQVSALYTIDLQQKSKLSLCLLSLTLFLPSSVQCFYIETIHLICIVKNQKKVVDKESMLIPGKIKETTFH